MNAEMTVRRFNDCINERRLADLVALMTEDHAFIDAHERTLSGRAGVKEAWRGFFDAFPDYRNVFESVTVRGDTVWATGHSECSDPALRGPAIWTATVRGRRISTWRVEEDTPEARAKVGLA